MNANDKTVLGWGILATGNIAQQFCDDLINVKGNRIAAVTSRKRATAQAFAQSFKQHDQIPNCYDNYDDMLKDDNVDVVYVATPHVYHFDQTIAALNAGKHVVCEKPIAMTPAQVEQCVTLAKQKQCFLLEAVWMNFFPTIHYAQVWIAQGKIGQPLSLEANFDFHAPYDPNSRLFDLNLGGGALMDIGLYPLFFATQLFGNAKLKDCNSVLAETGADIYAHVSLLHQQNITSHAKFSFLQDLPSEAVIYGEKGFIKLHNRFFCGNKISLHSYDGSHQDKEFVRDSRGYEFEIIAARHAILSGAIETIGYSHQQMLDNHQLLAEIRHKIGVHYGD